MARITVATPANYATTVTLPRVYNLQYPGDALVVTASVAGASGYEVRDYTGTVIASGAWSGTSGTIGTAGTAPFDKYGWYTLRLTGTDRADGAFGTDYGTCRFTIVENFTGIPQAPLRSSNPPNVTSALFAPLAHGVFSLGGFRESLLAQKLAPDRQHNSASATSATSLVLSMPANGGGTGGAVTSQSAIVCIHIVNGDATGMGTPDAGWTTQATATQGTLTVKVYYHFGNSGLNGNSPASINLQTTNAASHLAYFTEVQWVDNTAPLIVATPFTGNAASAVLSQDMTTLAPGTTEYYLTSFCATDTQAPTGITSSTLTSFIAAGSPQRLSGTSDAFGGGRNHTATYTFAGATNYVGFVLAYKAQSTYTADLTSTKAAIDAAWSTWGQYGDPNRPYRQITVQTLSSGSSALVNHYSQALSRVVSDVSGYADPAYPGFVGGFTARNEPQGTYSVSEAQAFKTTVAAGSATAKALGPDYVSLNFHSQAQTEFFTECDAGLYGAGGLDGISYHDYNMCNGDIANVRAILDALAAGLASRSLTTKPMFVTEGGQDTAYWPGVLRARAAGAHYMLNVIAREVILGVPYERQMHYYDRRGGYDQVTTWQSSDSGPYSGWPMHRAYARELYGKRLAKQYDMGGLTHVLIGGEFRSPTDGTGVAVVIGAKGAPALTCYVGGGATQVTVVDCFGNTSTTAVSNSTISLTPTDLPTYVRLPAGVSFSPRPPATGQSLLRSPLSLSFADSGDGTAGSALLGKIVDSDRRSSYAYSSSTSTVGSTYSTSTTTFPRNITITLPFDVITTDRLTVYCPVAWQNQPALFDFDLQYTTDGTTWVTAGTFTQTSNTVKHYDVASDTMADAYTEAQHYFSVNLGSTQTIKGVQLVVRAGTTGMYLDATWRQPPGDTNVGTSATQSVQVAEVAAYNVGVNALRLLH